MAAKPQRKSQQVDQPFAGDVKSPDELREPQVAATPETSFDERTQAAVPWLINDDGEQVTGAGDVTETSEAKESDQ